MKQVFVVQICSEDNIPEGTLHLHESREPDHKLDLTLSWNNIPSGMFFPLEIRVLEARSGLAQTLMTIVEAAIPKDQKKMGWIIFPPGKMPDENSSEPQELTRYDQPDENRSPEPPSDEEFLPSTEGESDSDHIPWE